MCVDESGGHAPPSARHLFPDSAGRPVRLFRFSLQAGTAGNRPSLRAFALSAPASGCQVRLRARAAILFAARAPLRFGALTPCLRLLRLRLRGDYSLRQRLGGLALGVHVHVGVDVHDGGACGVPGENLHDLGMHVCPRECGKIGMAKLVEAEALGAFKRSSIRKSIPPFTDWQNDLHLIVDIAHTVFISPALISLK